MHEIKIDLKCLQKLTKNDVARKDSGKFIDALM